MMNTTTKISTILFLSFALMACSKTNSSNVKTKGMYVTFDVAGNNLNQVACQAQFQVGGGTGTYLELDGADTVTCDGQRMSKSEFLGIVTYTTNLPYQVGKNYKIIFSREGEAPYESTAILPSAIASTSPAPNIQVKKGLGLTVSWTSDADPRTQMDLTLSYDVPETGQTKHVYHYLTDSAPENGVLGFGASDTMVTPAVSGAWAAEVKLKRVMVGSLAPGLVGVVTGSQEKMIPLTFID